MKSALERIRNRNTTGSKSTWFRRSVAMAVLVTGAIVLSATAASAAPVVLDTDPIRVTGGTGKVDFGSGAHSATLTAPGVPAGSGTVEFKLFAKTIVAHVTGTVYYDDPFTGGCGSVRVTMYNTDGERVANDYSGNACRDGSGLPPTSSVSKFLDGAYGYRVRVVTRVSYDHGAHWADVAWSDTVLGGA